MFCFDIIRPMKYLVFSDLHGSMEGLGKLRAAIDVENPDALICLGDILYGAYDGSVSSCASFFSDCRLPIIGVRGNCDRREDEHIVRFALPEERVFYFKNHRLLLQHAPFYQSFKKGDIVMYGHTHVKTLHKDNDVIYLNPGSIGKPRDGEAGYAILSEEGIFLKSADSFLLIHHESI